MSHLCDICSKPLDNGTGYDIFKLQNYYNELIVLPGLGQKSIDKLLEAVENSKKNNY